jgi:small subunit ribosomal protein S1
MSEQGKIDNGQGKAADEFNFEEMLEASFVDYRPLQRGDIREAVILQVRQNEVLVDLGAKRDGIVPSNDLERLDDAVRAGLKVGDTMPVYVLNPRDDDGNLLVSINLGLQQYDWERAEGLLKSQEIAEVTVTGYNKGGILVSWGRLEGFIPSSHLMTMSAQMNSSNKRDAFSDLRGRTLGVKVIEVDQRRRRLIFSEREAQREWRAQQKARLMNELVEGDVVRGTVTGIRDFGAFVDLGGADGLIHVSELAWYRVDHPGEVVSVGEELDVYVLELDSDRNRIALSRKRLLTDPWDDVDARYHEGMEVWGTVTNVVDFGAFIVTDDGLEGLLHLSEMGDGNLQEPHSYVKKGDRLRLNIARLEPNKRRVGFTQRNIAQELETRLEAGTEAAAPEETTPIEASLEAEAPEAEAAPEETTPVEASLEAEAPEAEAAPEETTPIEASLEAEAPEEEAAPEAEVSPDDEEQPEEAPPAADADGEDWANGETTV